MSSAATGELAQPSPELRALLRNVFVCYFLSGALGLVYQILWLRKLLLVFGSTVHAVSTVLTVFFGGLALGSWLFGRLIDRREGSGLRWYAALEAGVGLYAFLTLPLFDLVQHLYIPVYRASGFSQTVLVAASFVCSALILIIPTTLLGGTFPVLSRFLIRSSEGRAVKIATLYGINTAGAMLGTLFVYFAGLPVLGLQRTLVCAGVLNLGVGGLCFLMDRHLESLGFHETSTPAPQTETEADPPPSLLRWLGVAFACSGFSAMVYEVAWTRALSLVLGSSIYAFCIMLATFLGGMALGSFAIRRDLRAGASTFGQFVRYEWVLGVYGLCSVILFSELPEWFVRLWPLLGRSFAGLSWLQFTVSAAAMLLPTIVMGMLFPVVSDLVTVRLSQLGRRLGTVYAVNTLGGIVGSFLAGFVLIPRWGLPWAIASAAGVNIAAGLLIDVLTSRRMTPVMRLVESGAVLVLVFVVSSLVIVPTWRQQVFAAGVYLNPQAYQDVPVERAAGAVKLLYYRDSLNATVSVHQDGDQLFLKVGGKTDASNGTDMGTQVLSAHLPLLLHRNPASALVIGLGSGVTLGSVGRHPLSTIHCAEIDPAVIEGARYFKAYNYGIHDDPRATLYAADGRNFLLASPRQYDVIISEPSNPWMAGIAYLFTKEFYELAKQRLAPGGIMCQWLQLYRIFPGDVKLMLNTFHAAFPHVSVWSSLPGDLLLVGSMEPQRLDLSAVAQRMADPKVRQSLERIAIDRPELLLQLFLMGNAEVERLTGDVLWVHEDDRPSVEFHAPKALYLHDVFKVNYHGLRRFAAPPQTMAPDYRVEALDGAFYDALGFLRRSRHEQEEAIQAFEEAVRRDPQSAQAWVHLGRASLQARLFVKGEAALQQALALDPRHAQAHALMGKLQWKFGNAAEARRHYERSAALQPPDGRLAAELGDFFRDQHEFRWAAEWYRSAVSQGGEAQPAVIWAFAETAKGAEEWGSAESALRFGMRRFPNDAAFPLLFGQLEFARGRGAAAAPWLSRALALHPQLPDAYYGLARIAADAGSVQEAVMQLQRGLEYDPYHRDALELLQQLRRVRHN
ncbi:MAG: fused MFS/spermidine synthase [Candidatus Omnitrophica bacterium]|nr:fused MFS/spermidine synthase [Candidatus Omnitrophota bacterium]